VIIDICRDCWEYSMLGILSKKSVKGEVGSSTMPQKLNPIKFENAEGNAKIARMWCVFMAQEYQTSRLQRDLTDSTIARNIGVVISHAILAIKYCREGFLSVNINEFECKKSLLLNPQILSEALQLSLRIEDCGDYKDIVEQLRGKEFDIKSWNELVSSTKLSEERKLSLTFG